MIRPRCDVRSVVAVIAILFVVSGVAFGTQRLVVPTFGAPTQVHTGKVDLASSLPAIENRDLTDSTDAKRWSALGLLIVAAAVATGLMWQPIELQGRVVHIPGLPTICGRGPPKR